MKKKFWSPVFGTIEIGLVYTWIKALVKLLGYQNVEYDPVFDMVDLGDSVEVSWTDRFGASKMISFVRMA